MITQRFSDSQFNVLGWDPRGVNISQPVMSCFPYDASRDRWSLLTSQYYETLASPRAQLEIVDAMYESIYRACWEQHGDLGRFLGTAFVARDLEEIRKALGEDELTGYLVSYGTAIGQTYSSMFPDSVGRVILDGTEYVRDHRVRGGFGFTGLDNITDAWHDGFLGECLNVGPEYCPLARPKNGTGKVTLEELEDRMGKLLSSLATRPIPGYTEANGPTLITYSSLVVSIYSALYDPRRWPPLARTLYELEDGNSTLAAKLLDNDSWWFDPTLPCPEVNKPSSRELSNMVICSDSYDASEPDDFDWWLSLWANMTEQSWIGGNSRFYDVFPCRHFNDFWPEPAEVFRGNLSVDLKNPVLLIAEIYDPATPLRNGRRLASEMGPENSRLIVHHGYGHTSSADLSNCTNSIGKAYILEGKLPEDLETDCYADRKPGVGFSLWVNS